jgi:hypothetical protein
MHLNKHLKHLNKHLKHLNKHLKHLNKHQHMNVHSTAPCTVHLHVHPSGYPPDTITTGGS